MLNRVVYNAFYGALHCILCALISDNIQTIVMLLLLKTLTIMEGFFSFQ